MVEEKALLQNGEYQSVVYLKGVDENYRYVTGVADRLVKGEYDIGTDDSPKLILARVLKAHWEYRRTEIFSNCRFILPRKSNTEQLDPINDISNDTIRTSAAFVIQQDFDNKYGITNIDFAEAGIEAATQ